MSDQKLGPNPTPFMGHAAFHPYPASEAISGRMKALIDEHDHISLGGHIYARPDPKDETIATLTRLLGETQRWLVEERAQGNRLATQIMELQAMLVEARKVSP